MLYKNNYIHKAISATLLFLLLFIHSIKLLHTHSNIFFSNHSCRSNGPDKNDSQVAKSFADCSICSYQLTKDADDLVYHASDICNPEQRVFNTPLISFHKLSFHTAFENRGPPGIA